MPLLNYTTTVDALRTASQVHEILVKAGARQIMSSYNDQGRPTAVAFQLTTQFGPRSFLLPVNVDAVHKVMGRYKSGVPNRYQTRDQAERVAWRILKDWLEAQLAIIDTEMVTADQVLLPYMTTEDGGTVYARYLEEGQRALGAGTTS